MATYYINADTGNDTTGAGTVGNPWLTVGKAHDSAAANDTIVLQDSTADYTLASKTFTKILTLTGEQDDASGAQLSGNGQWRLDATALTLSKITFKNCTTVSGQGCFWLNTAVTVAIDVSQCIFHDITTVSNTNSGIFFASAASSVFNITLTSVAMYNITIPNFSQNGIFARNNGTCNTTITSSTFAFGSSTVSKIFGNTTGGTWLNCIVSHNTSATYSGSSTGSATYSCFYNISGAPTGTGVITSDPLLVDVANGILFLLPDSPCLYTGDLF